MRKPFGSVPAFILATLVLASTTVASASPVTTVILVRHAEKTAAGPMMAADAPLSEAGLLRAAELARVLGDAGITAIYTTPFERTRKTAAPLAAKLGLQPIEIAPGKDYAEQMAKEIRGKDAGRTVLIVGHSNTTPELMRKLSVANVRDMPESEYDNLYIVTLSGAAPPRVVRLHYGAPAR